MPNPPVPPTVPQAPAPPPGIPPKKRSGCLRRLLVPAIVLVAAIGWLDARGAAMLARYVLLRQAAAAGLSGEVEVTGYLRDGLEISRVRLAGGGLIRAIDGSRIRAGWHWREFLSGKIQSLESDRLRVVVDVAGQDPGGDARPEGSSSTAPAADAPARSPSRPDWPSLRAAWQSHGQPTAIHLRGLEIQVLSGARTLGQLQPTRIVHEAGENRMTIDLGELAGPAGPTIPAQSITLDVGKDALSVDTLVVPGGWSLGPVAVQPDSGKWSAGARHGEARLEVSADGPRAPARLRLLSGTLDVPSLAAPWLDWPEDAALTIDALDLTCGNWHRPPVEWEVDATVGAPSLAWQGWSAAAFKTTARYQSGRGTAAMETRLENAPIAVNADVDFSPGGFAAGKATARLQSPAMGPLVAAARARYLPASAHHPTLTGAWSMKTSLAWNKGEWSDLHFQTEGKDLHAGDRALPATSLAMHWPDASSAMTITAGQSDAAKAIWSAGGTWHPSSGNYQATFATTGTWDPGTVMEAAALFGFAPPVALPPLAIRWNGNGEVPARRHAGQLDLDVPEIKMGPRPAAALHLSGTYQWPESLALTSFTVRDGPEDKKDQIDLRLDWNGKTIDVSDWTVQAGGVPIGGGMISMPWTPDVRSLGQWMESPGSIAGDIRLDSHPMAVWEKWLPENQRPGLAGEMGARLRLGGTPARPEINLEVLADGLKHPAMGDAPPGKVLLRLANARDNALELTADLEHAGIEPIHARLQIPFDAPGWAGNPGMALEAPVSGSARMGSLEIGRYASMVPSLREMSGRFDAELAIAGSLSRPQLMGRASLANGLIAPRNPSIGKVEGITLEMSFDGDNVRLTRGEARLGGGVLDISGQAGRMPDGKTGMSLALKGDHLLLWRDASVLVRASPDLTLTGGDGRWKFSGEIPLVECLYLRDFEFIPLGTVFTVPAAPVLPRFNPPQPPAAAREKGAVIDLDVGIAFRDPMLIRGNVARGQVTGAVRITGTADAPVADGAAVLTDAVARLPFSTLRVARGELVFQPGRGLTPDIRIEGRSKLPPYEVTVRVSGPADSPSIHLISEPPLPGNEILALLATGSTTNALEDPANAQAKALQLLVSELRGGRLPFGRRLADLLGPLENVQVQIGQESPYDGRARNGVAIELTDRFLLTGAVDAEGNQRLTLTFLLRFH